MRRVEALGHFLDTEDGANLLAGFKRAANILRIEEKKDGQALRRRPRSRPDPGTAARSRERRWPVRRSHAAATRRKRRSRGRISKPRCVRLSQLRAPVDAFFDKVTVNAEDPALRDNRLRLLHALREATRAVARFQPDSGR